MAQTQRREGTQITIRLGVDNGTDIAVMDRISCQQSEPRISLFVWQVDRDEEKLRRMANDYRASRRHIGLVRYFKLKWIIHDAIHELRME